MSRPATSRLKVNAPLGMRPSLENRRIGELQIDDAYQRSIETGPSVSLIRRIAQFWDWGLFQPLIVARRADGSFWVVDGQHRLAAAKLRGDIYDLPCVVTPYANAGDEAATFVALNVQRRALSRLDLFRAALAANDDVSTEIALLISAAGLEIAPHTNNKDWKPGLIGNIAGLVAARQAHGSKVLGRALRILARGFEGQVQGYAGTIFPGIARTVAEISRVDDGLLVSVLSGADQRTWFQEIERKKLEASITRPAASYEIIRAAYLEAAEEAEAA